MQSYGNKSRWRSQGVDQYLLENIVTHRRDIRQRSEGVCNVKQLYIDSMLRWRMQRDGSGLGTSIDTVHVTSISTIGIAHL